MSRPWPRGRPSCCLWLGTPLPHASPSLMPAPPSLVPLPQARTAVGWEPEGVHLTLWGPDAVLVSWQTGGECSVGSFGMPAWVAFT